MTLVSLYLNTTSTVPSKNGPVTTILQAIKSGFWKDQIERLRSLPLEEYKEGKRSLVSVTFSGTFSERNAEKIEEYSKIIVIDIDHLELSQIKAYKEEFSTDPYIYCAFISPSNAGLKILFKLDCEKDQHLNAFTAIKKYLEDKYAMSVDKTGKDICRLCYISYDPNMYLNDDSLPWTDLPIQPILSPEDKKKWLDAKFIGKKVSNDVQYIFNVSKKWVEKSFQCVPGSYNNYVHALACILNRVGISFNDTMILFESNLIIPDDKWKQSVRSSYFHNKKEYNTVPVYELSREVPEIKPIEDERQISSDDVENDIILTAIKLLNKNVDIADIITIITAYANKYVKEDYIELDNDAIRKLLSRAYNNSDLARIVTNSLDARQSKSMLGGIMASLTSKSIMTSGFKEFDVIMGGGPKPGNFYGVIGVGGTFKSIFVQNMACENSKNGVPVLFLNGEMSQRQYFERLFNKELKLDFNQEIENGQLNQGNYHEYSHKIDEILNHNLFCVTGTGFTKDEIINTIDTTEKQTGKRIKMVIIDGLSQMADICGNEIMSSIANSSVAKDIAKEADVAIIALIHTSGNIGKHYRQTSDNVRGGTKITNNMDSFFCTSLLIDPSTLDQPNDDVLYIKDKLYLRYNDKRGSGEILSKIIQVSRPMSMEVLNYDLDVHEIKIDKK